MKAMPIFRIIFLISFILLCAIVLTACNSEPDQIQYRQPVESSNTPLLVDPNERLHLLFMREEEKLARDVYTTLGMHYPQLAIFGNITKSEQQHTNAVLTKLNTYQIPDPVASDNVGAFSSEEFGRYFTEKYQQLIAQGSVNSTEALYVGALIEELDMLDIRGCPQVIIQNFDSAYDVTDCGLVYTDNTDIQRLYQSLLTGSESHLRAFVKLIERDIGEGNYAAQLLDQADVDAILDR